MSMAVPAFIGFTEKLPEGATKPQVSPIGSYLEFESTFGGPKPALISVELTPDPEAGDGYFIGEISPNCCGNVFRLAYAVEHYFLNGDGPCFVVSLGTYLDYERRTCASFEDGIAALDIVAGHSSKMTAPTPERPGSDWMRRVRMPSVTTSIRVCALIRDSPRT
ncbi:MAG: hypothetical protein AAF585_22725, partial [Verrucomicrobiota bacterium]